MEVINFTLSTEAASLFSARYSSTQEGLLLIFAGTALFQLMKQET